ncbi:MAG: DUF2730 family protein [Deltaproteobacteria bacterium]|nr:DUF2730 family protein [Deltaproteobacteria bacterium]MCX7952293.1 DUF2730 family protein [Deltaproteobacteria bacterium]
MLTFWAVLAGIIPCFIVYLLIKKKLSSSQDLKHFQEALDKINNQLSALEQIDFSLLFPREAFEQLKERKEKVKGEIDAIRAELTAIDEKIKLLNAKLEEKEKYHQQLKLPDPQVETETSNCIVALTEAIESFSAMEKSFAELLSEIENLGELDPQRLPFKQNLNDYALELGSVSRAILLLLKDLKEKLLSLKSQIDDLEVEFAKLLERQVSQ